MEDREGCVKQLKRELGDIRVKLSRILGQERNQEENPFSVGERVVITILPHENRNKLLAKWKGPFTITKVPNRFQIEYLEDRVSALRISATLRNFASAPLMYKRSGCVIDSVVIKTSSRWQTCSSFPVRGKLSGD